MRHCPCDVGALPPDSDPALDEFLVRSGGDAQLGDLPVPGCILASFAEAGRGTGAFGQQIGAPGRGAFTFGYIRNAKAVHDFPGLLGFDDLYRTYESPELFPLFAQRAMDPRRPDYHRYVNTLGLEGEPGPWEQIARSQGHREGDTIQLFPEPTVDGDEARCLFLVHGMRHADKSPKIINGVEASATRKQIDTALERLEPGDDLGIFREPGNEKNPLAIVVTISPDQLIPVGWVPDLLVEDLQRLLDCAHVTVTAAHVNGTEAPWHLRLLARLRAAPAAGFRVLCQRQVGTSGAAGSVGEHVRKVA